MSQFFYNIFVHALQLGMMLISPWNSKVKAGVLGRKNWKASILAWEKRKKNGKLIWMHCASLGEFEQGRPVLEGLKKKHPEAGIVLSFFSPSGFLVQENYEGADLVCYLPMDTPGNAAWFLDHIQPTLVIWVKYEYWYYILKEIHERNIPVLLVSAIFRNWQNFFKFYGSFWRKILTYFDAIFVQDSKSLELLAKSGFTGNAMVAGDTRFDRVLRIAEHPMELPSLFPQFCEGHKIIVAGSTWPEDEKILLHYANLNRDVKYIIIPHQVGPIHMKEIHVAFKNSILYTQIPGIEKNIKDYHVLIIDAIGMLSSIYQFADITYVGGGFGDAGIHNTLEAAVYGKPVIFGPEHEKFAEAIGLLEAGAAFDINSALELENKLDEFLNDGEKLEKAGKAAGNYVQANAGATDFIINYIEENLLLIN